MALPKTEWVISNIGIYVRNLADALSSVNRRIQIKPSANKYHQLPRSAGLHFRHGRSPHQLRRHNRSLHEPIAGKVRETSFNSLDSSPAHGCCGLDEWRRVPQLGQVAYLPRAIRPWIQWRNATTFSGLQASAWGGEYSVEPEPCTECFVWGHDSASFGFQHKDL